MINETNLLNDLKLAKNIEGFMAQEECDILYNAALNISNNLSIVEIGSYQGQSTAALGLGSKYGNQSLVYAIDLWGLHLEDRHEPQYEDDKFFDIFKRNMEQLKLTDIVIPIQGPSIEIVKTWNKPIGLLFIDGSHRYKDVKEDFDNWYPYVITEGIILFHDFNKEDIKNFVREQEDKTIKFEKIVHITAVCSKL